MFGFRKKKIREAEALKQSIAHDKEVLNKIQNDKMSLEAELESIKKELRVLQANKIQSLQEEEKIKANNKELGITKLRLGEEVTALQEIIENLHINQVKQQEIVHQYNHEEQNLKEQLTKLDKQRQEVSEEKKQLQDAVSTLKGHLKELEEIKIHSEEEKTILIQKQKLLQDEVQKTEAKKAQLYEQYKSLEDQIHSLNIKASDLDEVVGDSEGKIAALEAQHKQLVSDVKNLEVCKAQLEKQSDSLQERIVADEEKLHGLDIQVKELGEVIQKSNTENNLLQEQQHQLVEDIKKLELCKVELEKQSDSLQERIVSDEEKLHSLDSRIKELDDIIQKNNAENNLLQEQQCQLAEDIKDLEVCKLELEKQSDSLQERIVADEEKRHSLDIQIKELNEVIQKSNTENDLLQENQNQLIEDVKKLETCKLQLEQQSDSLQESIKVLEISKSQLKEQNNALKEEVAANQDKVAQLNDEVKELNEIIERDKATEDKLGKQIIELTRLVEMKEEKSKASQVHLDKLAEEIERLEAFKLDLESKNHTLMTEIEKASSFENEIERNQDQASATVVENTDNELKESQDEVSATVVEHINNEIKESQNEATTTKEESSDEVLGEVNPLLKNLLDSIFGSDKIEEHTSHKQDETEWIDDLNDSIQHLEEADEPQTVLEEMNEAEAADETELTEQIATNKTVIIVELKDKNIDEIEVELEGYFRDIELVGDIYLALEDYNTLKRQLTEAASESSETSLKIRYSNCIVLFMVYTAVYHYDNSYWEYVEECFEQIPRTKLMEIFMGVLKRFELPQFGEYTNALKNITPILCHSGVPHKCMQGLLQGVEELGNRGEGVLIGKEAFKELLSEKIDKPVARYIDYLEDSWETFLLECQEALQSDTLQEYKTILPHMAHFILGWRVNDETLLKGKRTKILMPRLYIEPDGIGVYLLLPEQKFYEEEVGQVRWRIISDNVEEKAIDPVLHYNGTYYFIKEMKLPIRETSRIIIHLSLNEEHYRSWQINHLDENFIAFNEAGELVGKEVGGQREHFILLKQPYRLKNPSIIIESLDQLLLWPSYKGYRVNIHDISCIAFGKTGYASEEIQLKKDSKPILFGGRYLFGKESIQTVANYMRLPELVIYDMLPRNEWNRLKIVFQGEDFAKECTLASIKEKITLREGAISIALGAPGLIPEKCFGHYEIKLYKDMRIIGKVQFAYVPPIQAAKHLNQTGSYYQFTMPRSCKLNFQDGQLVSERDKGLEYRIELWKFTDVGQSVEGKLTYTSNEGKSIDFRIDKQVRNISWGILQLSNLSEFKWSNKLATVSLENLKNQNDYYLVVEGEEILKSPNISLVLEDNQKQVLKCVNGLRCKEKATRMRIHLAEFIEVLSGKSADDCVLKLICKYDLYENEYRIICFQEKLVLKNLKCIIKKETINFTWEQEGGLNQREFLIYPIDRPWEEALIKSISDGKNIISLDKDELCEGRYGVLVRYEKDEWGFEEEEQDYQLGKMPILNLNHGVPYEPMDKVESYLHEIICSPTKIVNQSLPPRTLEKGALNKIFKTMTIIGENPDNYVKNTLDKIIEHTESIVLYHIEEYFKFILEAQLSSERFAYYCTAFNIYHNLMIKGIDLSKSQLQQLWKVNPMLGMLISLQMKEIDKENAMDKIFNYVGRQGIKNLIPKAYDASDCNPAVSIDNQQHHLEDCLKLSLWQECYCKSIKPVLSQDLIGDKQELREYFSHAASTWEVAARKKKRAAMQSQQILTQNQKSIFMGKTYLEVVMEMRNQNAAYIKEVSDKVHRILGLRRSSIKEFMQTGKHKKVLNLLMKRIEEGQHAEYWCGIIAYLQACESLGIKENIFTPYQSQQLTQLLSEQMNALYERDRIVFQIYLLMEG